MGSNYLSEEMVSWHKKDLLNRMYVPLKDNKKIAMPRYYKNKIYTDLEREQISKNMEMLEIKRIDLLTVEEQVNEYNQNKLIKLEKIRINSKNDQRLKTKL